MTWTSNAMIVIASMLAFSSSGCRGAVDTRTVTSPSAVALGLVHQALPARATNRFNDCPHAAGDNAVSIQQCLEDELAYAPFADVRPDERGALDIRSGDLAMTMRSDGCKGTSWLHCSSARLQVNTPSIAGQVIELRQMVFPGEGAPGALCRDSLRSGLDYACSIILTDVNGDGHEDLMVWTGHEGTYGDPSYTYFLYDSDAGRLAEDRELAEMVVGHSLSRIVDGRLEVWYRSGPCDRGEKTIDARGASPEIVEQADYDGCKQPPP